MSLGSRMKERREALHLKQSELGQMLGITGSAIGNYEKGVSFPKADILYKMFDALHCDANFLFQDEMEEDNNPETLRKNQMINLFLQLNSDGQNKLIDNADDLVSSGKYIKSHQDGQIQNA